MPRQPARALPITRSEREELLAISRYRATPQSVVLRVKIVLGAAEGLPNKALARQLSTTLPTVLLWRRRYEEAGLSGILQDQPRSGRPKRVSEKKEADIVKATMQSKPTNATHWSVRMMAKAQLVSRSTVHRIWQKHKLQPHRVESFKFSTDPDFVPKLRDVVGLYLNPPDKAIVLSVDEKSQIQALDRTQPILPLRPELPERQTHDYERHGTTTLFAALNVLEGTVIGQCQARHRHQEFLLFLDRIEASVQPRLEVHIVLDNYGTHKHPAVRRWFNDHPRYHVHFTPTGASWLNQIERWFAEITRKRIRRGTFRSVRQLVQAIREYIRENNARPRPFHWVAKPNAILRKLNRLTRTDIVGQMINVIVVLDPNYGDRLESAAQVAPMWVVASADNKSASKRLWNAHPIHDHREKGAVTCYDVGVPEDRLANLLDVLPTLEEHHGEIRDDRFSFPKGFVLKVIGLALADGIINALRDFGFSSFCETADGFQACK